MIHIKCKRQNGVVKRVSCLFQLPTATRASQWQATPSAVAGRPRAPAQPGAALRGSDGEGGRLGLHQARPGGGRGTGGGGARFRGLRGRGRRLGRGAPGQGPGPGAAGREQQVGCDRDQATGGWPEKCRLVGPGAQAAGGNAPAHLKETTPSPASSR